MTRMKLKGLATILAIVVATLLAANCTAVKKVGRATTDLVTGGGEPDPEQAWNRERTWKRISDQPPTYVPYNYDGPLGDEGEWVTDKRDGKRLYIPNMGVEGFPESVLRAEAWKATRKH